MSRFAPVFAALLVVGAILAPPRLVRAQDLGPERVQEALDLTDRRIDLAETLVSESSNANAVAELSISRSLQQQARAAFAAAQFAVALRATTEARTHADRAVAIVRGLPDPDRVSVQVERTREILDRARERIEACDNVRAQAILKVALEMQARAEQAVPESRYLAALQLTLSARERTYKAMRLCNLEDSIQDSAARALQHTDDVINHVHEVVETTPAPEPHDLVTRAGSIQVQAQGEFRAGRYESSLRLTQSARVMAQRAQRLARPDRGARRR